MMKLHGALVGVCLLFSVNAASHPHSFINMNTTFVAKDQRLVGLKMVWVMDEITSADLLYDAKNAKSNSVVWKNLAAQNLVAQVMTNVLGQHYLFHRYLSISPKFIEMANR